MIQVPSSDSTKLGLLGAMATLLGKFLHSAFRRRSARLRRLEERVNNIHDNYVDTETLQRLETGIQHEITQVNTNINLVHKRVDDVYTLLVERNNR